MSPPLGYLDAAGRRAATILPLTWALLAISIVVCVVIGIILWRAVQRAETSGGAAETRAVRVTRGSDGIHWIKFGLLISAVPLLVALVWTMVALASSSEPPSGRALTLEVTPHQWWWEVQYTSADPSATFATANEIHIPVGVPVLVQLHGADVIHSFWVPKLTGKTDAIPGRTNASWLQADAPGRYRGQCQEFCGAQHAHMSFTVVAEPQAQFEAWRAHQLQPAPAPQTPEQMRGRDLVEYRCGLCHKVRGTTAGAINGPDLTHVMSRAEIASGTLPNNAGTLAGWILNPQALKPGTLMPAQGLAGTQLADTVAYLETLK